MLSENKLERRTLGNPSQTVTDYQDTSDNDVLYNTIKIGLVGAASYALFKSGAMKGIAKSLLEVADTIAREGTDKASIAMHTIKEWSSLKKIPTKYQADYRIPRTSIFRERESSIFYDLVEDATNSVKKGKIDFHNVNSLMRGSVDDLHLLTRMIQDGQSGLERRRNNYLRTELNHRINNFLDFESTVEQYSERQRVMFTAKGMQEFMESMSISPTKAAQELKESGYRKLTLGDVVDFIHDEKGSRFVAKQGAQIDLASSADWQTDLLQNATRFFETHSYFDANGMRTNALRSGDWKNIIVDSSMRINESGNIIDYRMSRDSLVGFAHSLANDFKLPLVGFNPFKSLLGFDKIGRRNPFIGLISSDQIDPNITRRAGRVTINDWLIKEFGEEYAGQNIAIINGKAYVADMSDGIGNRGLIEIGDRLKLHDITYADESYGLKPTVNAGRQMANLSLGEPQKRALDDYIRFLRQNHPGTELNMFQKAKYQLGRTLDMGYQEIRPMAEEVGFSLDTSTSIDELTNKFINWATEKNMFRTNGYEYKDVQEMVESIKAYTHKSVFGDGFENFSRNGKDFKPRMYTTSKEGFKVKQSYDYYKSGNTEAAKEELKGFVAQFGSGRKGDVMGQYFTERTTLPWIVFNQLSEGLGNASHLFGLSVESKGSTASLVGNLLAKRALPVYMATQIPGMLNYLSEPFFGGSDETGNRDNITKFAMRNIVKPVDLGVHRFLDFVGATNVFKFLGEMTPGSDQINELPGIYQLGLGQTAEEREEYIENGYDPIRKGRWWGSGNTPFTGGKIMYWRPNIYRRVEADVEFSDSKWGSRQEYYNNTWYPNPINPLAPVNHFLLNRNYYDKKHYYDRPYLQTAPAGSNIPIIGPLYSATIGQILSPPQKMHMEYWRNGLQPIPGDEEPSTLLTEGMLYTQPFDNSKHDIHVYNQVEQQTATAAAADSARLYTSAYQAKQVTNRTITDNAGIRFEQRSILPIRSYDRYDTPYEVYSTPSGGLTVVDVPDEMNLYNVNQDLRKYSINKIIGTNQRVVIDDFQGPGIPVGNNSQLIDNSFIYSLGEQYNWLGDIVGLKGFALQTFITGEANERARMIENSGYAYSFNKDFWDMNFGGLGANLSEITRRFVPKRNNSVEYINPIRNTMPSWMPGSDYFTDFKHGDPYSKIENGEERLPGEGYERLHGIKNLMEFNIGSSSIGYEKDYIIKHMLKSDKYMSTFEEDTLEKGNEIHKAIEQEWLKSGFAIDVEGKVEDKRHGIIGWYDAKVHDPTSRTGVAIIDIKSTSAKKLDELRAAGKPLTHHMRQTNYYLWATGNQNSRGYIHYIDKEDPTNTYTVGFDYNEDELRTTLNNVHEARQTIRGAVEKGIIGRGELYDVMDQFRILADVAPYSQEFRDVSAQLASEKLTPEEQKEASQIRDRLAAQKEPLRVYPYKFKTSNLKTETVTVAKIVDNNTIVTKEYGKEHSIKFAGIRVSDSNSEMFDDKRTKSEAARDKIRHYIRPGQRIQISYDADERNKYSKDSTRSIRAVVNSRGRNVNQILLNSGHATENENDDSPAGIQARYSKGEIAFGSMMETLTHGAARIPFIGNKFIQVRSPYEQYRKREVYGKDFQSWNHPIRDMLVPSIQENIADNSLMGLGGIVTGAFIGSLFGKRPFGKLVGAVVGGTLPAVGKIGFVLGTDSERDWRPKRRREQEKLNEYVDVLKYVKNMRLYEQYKTKAKKENNFDVESFIKSKEYAGYENKARQKELTDYKRKVKLDFKHRDRYNFKYGKPKYAESSMSKKDTISAINREIAELQGQRKVTKVPENAIKAIQYKQAAEQTMYGYDPGESLANIMTALPKKERQYFKHFMDAPEEEKQKILRIAPSYLRRALQSTWGMKIDRKPSLDEYFRTHGLPDASWIGWDESVNMDDVKVKLIHQNKLDPGEFDVWEDNEVQADQVNIPIPMIDANNSPYQVNMKLNQILGKAGYDDIQTSFMHSSNGNNTSFIIKRDARGEVSQQIAALQI